MKQVKIWKQAARCWRWLESKTKNHLGLWSQELMIRGNRLLNQPSFRIGLKTEIISNCGPKDYKQGKTASKGNPSFWVGFVFLVFLCSGCDRLPLINKFGFHTNLKDRAEQAEASGKYRQALDLYERCLDGSPLGTEANYRMALIYDSKLQDPIAALYHFQRFVEKKPNDPRVKEISKDIKRLRLLLASQLSDGVVVSRADAIRLKNENLQLQAQLALLRSQKAAPRVVQEKKGFSTNAVTRAAERLVDQETRTYIVVPGDTLALISRKFYKTPNRWKDIADANQNRLKGSTRLKVGMTLIIP